MGSIKLDIKNMDRFDSINGLAETNYQYSVQKVAGEYHAVISDNREISGTTTYRSKMCLDLTEASKFLNKSLKDLVVSKS